MTQVEGHTNCNACGDYTSKELADACLLYSAAERRRQYLGDEEMIEELACRLDHLLYAQIRQQTARKAG